MTATQVTVTLTSSNQRPAGRGFMVIGDGTVDGQETDVIFWDPPQAEKLGPGAVVTVEFDGVNAKWNERGGKKSFQIKPQAKLTFQEEGSAAPQGTSQGTTPLPTSKKTPEEILSRGAELVGIYLDMLVQQGLPEDVVHEAAATAPLVVSSWWFGDPSRFV